MTTTTTVPNVNAVQGENPLRGLLAYGQSPWLDFIRRNILLNGDLKKMIANDGLRGMTLIPRSLKRPSPQATTTTTLSMRRTQSLQARWYCTKRSRSVTCKMRRIFSGPSIPKPRAATAT